MDGAAVIQHTPQQYGTDISFFSVFLARGGFEGLEGRGGRHRCTWAGGQAERWLRGWRDFCVGGEILSGATTVGGGATQRWQSIRRAPAVCRMRTA